MFATIMFTSMFIVNVDAGKKKKILAALLLGAALAAKPKILPIPLPIPIPFKQEEKKYVPVPQPYPI
ncbi:hypothetical protein BLA29_012115 [Euroglyphus maynei]|uniref:Uncharacterized protein n=1 Tax=Euroglyphus maynei TaxID=6958 RepID=A0A1Y3BP73_EURMA|nr:hypothetical protein BLA29_012115 [Euroglyphus maynei]